MLPRNKWVWIGSAAVVIVIAAWIVGDSLILTDEERIEEFSELVTDDIDDEHLVAALQHADPRRQPILVEVRGESMRFDTQSQEGFAAMARSRLRPFEGTGQHVLRRDITLQGERASLLTETFSRRGRVTVDWELRKHENDWLISRVSVR